MEIIKKLGVTYTVNLNMEEDSIIAEFVQGIDAGAVFSPDGNYDDYEKKCEIVSDFLALFS